MTGFGVYPPLMDGHPTDPHLDLTAALGSLLPPPGGVPGSGIQAQSGVFLVNNPGVPTGRQLFAESTDPCNAATGCLALQQSSTGNPICSPAWGGPSTYWSTGSTRAPYVCCRTRGGATDCTHQVSLLPTPNCVGQSRNLFLLALIL